MGKICMKTHIPPNEAAAAHIGIPPSFRAAETPSVTSKIILSHIFILSFSINENATFSSAEKRIIHADIDIIAFAEFETEDVKTSENETLSVFFRISGFLFRPGVLFFRFDMNESRSAVTADDKNTEKRTAVPDNAEFKTVTPTVFIIKPGPAFTQNEISLRAVKKSILFLSNSCFISRTPTGYPPMNEKITAHMHVGGMFNARAPDVPITPKEKAPSLYAVSDSTAKRKSDGMTASKHIEIPRLAPSTAYEGLSIIITAKDKIIAVLSVFFVLPIFISPIHYYADS